MNHASSITLVSTFHSIVWVASPFAWMGKFEIYRGIDGRNPHAKSGQRRT